MTEVLIGDGSQAVLVCRLAWKHPLLDGNRPAAWAALVVFIDLNQGTWDANPPDIDDAEESIRHCLRRRRRGLGARHD